MSCKRLIQFAQPLVGVFFGGFMRAAHAYYLYDATVDLGLAITTVVYTPFLMSIGLSLGEISLVNAIFWLAIVLAEIPTGLFADGKSRVWSLKMGCILFMLGGFTYFFACGFWSAAIAESLLGIGMAFFSGAEQAWVTDALHREGRDEERRQVFATASIIRGFVMIIGGFIGTLITLSNPRGIWLPMIFTSLLALFFIHKWMNGKGEPIHKMTEIEAFRASISLLRGSRALMWVIAATVVFGAVIAFNHFWTPYFKPLVGTFGINLVWATIYLGFAFSGVLIRRMKIAQGNESKAILVALVLSGIGLILAGKGASLWFPLSAVAIHEFGRGMFAPLVDSFVQHRVESGYRATFGSLQSLLGRIGLVIAPVLIYLTIRNEPDTPATIGFVWFGCGIILVFGAFVLSLVRPK